MPDSAWLERAHRLVAMTVVGNSASADERRQREAARPDQRRDQIATEPTLLHTLSMPCDPATGNGADAYPRRRNGGWIKRRGQQSGNLGARLRASCR